mmetsp:Transcript_28401/g.71323  ORF Transcript_28401/g.71323 Transcript_28401/m.71323 type:complete len:203 (-) Transcript_28401:1425-2033(-)
MEATMNDVAVSLQSSSKRRSRPVARVRPAAASSLARVSAVALTYGGTNPGSVTPRVWSGAKKKRRPPMPSSCTSTPLNCMNPPDPNRSASEKLAMAHSSAAVAKKLTGVLGKGLSSYTSSMEKAGRPFAMVSDRMEPDGMNATSACSICRMASAHMRPSATSANRTLDESYSPTHAPMTSARSVAMLAYVVLMRSSVRLRLS